MSGNSKILALLSFEREQLPPICFAEFALFSSTFPPLLKNQGDKTFIAKTTLSCQKKQNYYIPEKTCVHLFHGTNILLRINNDY